MGFKLAGALYQREEGQEVKRRRTWPATKSKKGSPWRASSGEEDGSQSHNLLTIGLRESLGS